MAGFNQITIIGNLGRDPEMRFLPSGTAVTSFSVAVTRRWNSAEGEAREETEWFRVSCFNKLAEIANQYLTKGKQVFIQGRVSLDTWDDRQTGEKRSGLAIRASDVVFLGQRGDQQSGGYEPATAGAAPEAPEFDNMPF